MVGQRKPGVLGTDPPAENQSAEDHSGLLGDGFLPGPIGTEVSLISASAGKQTSKSSKGTELNLVGDFPNPWAGNPKKERNQLAADKWWPSTPDFLAVAGKNSIAVAGAWDFLLQIIKTAKPIGRLNFFSHGVTGIISIQGTIAPSGDTVKLGSDAGAKWTQMFGQAKAIVDPYAGVWTPKQTGTPTVTIDNHTLTLDDVRAKFTKDAEMWLFLCHGASDPLLVQQVANTFQVTVKAFSHTIVYCVPQNFPTSRRHRLALQTTPKPKDSCPNAVNDFHSLTGNVDTVKPKKP